MINTPHEWMANTYPIINFLGFHLIVKVGSWHGRMWGWMTTEPRRGHRHFRMGTCPPVARRTTPNCIGSATRFFIQERGCNNGGRRCSFVGLLCQSTLSRRIRWWREKKLTPEGTQSPCSYGGGSSSGTLPRSLHLASALAPIPVAIEMEGRTDGRR